MVLLGEKGGVVWSTGALGRAINLVRWSPNGDLLAALLDRRLVVLDSSGRIVLDSGLLPDGALSVAWAPGGDVVYVSGFFGVRAYATEPIEVGVPGQVILPEGRGTIELSLKNPLPRDAEAVVTAWLDGAKFWTGAYELPARGIVEIPLDLNTTPGRHELRLRCSALGSESFARVVIESITNLSLAAWASSVPGGPVNLTVALTNPNPLEIPVRVEVLEEDGELVEWIEVNLSPGVLYESWEIHLGPGTHDLTVRVVGPADIELAEERVSVAVVGPTVPLKISTPSRFELGSWSLSATVENPYELTLNLTLEVFIDGNRAVSENLSVPPGGEASASVTLSQGTHWVYARVLAQGHILAEGELRVNVLPQWFLALPLALTLALAAALYRRIRS